MRRVQALEVPTAELERMKATLAPRYGSELWDPEGMALLVVRVPRDEPDLVNDLEGAVEYLAPADVAQAKVTLFVGHAKSHIVPTPTLQGLMESRTAQDQAQADQLRRTLKPGEWQVFQAPGDPRRVTRLGLRVACPRVADLGEQHLHAFLPSLGPRLHQPPLSQVRAVQIVADQGDVRLDADLFFQDLGQRWREEQQRRDLARRLAEQQAAAQAAASPIHPAPKAIPPPSRQADALGQPAPNAHQAPTSTRPPASVTAHAPLRAPPAARHWDGEPAPLPAYLPPPPPAQGMGDVFEVGEGPAPAARSPQGHAPSSAASRTAPVRPGTLSQDVPSTIAASHQPDTNILASLEARLRSLGYATLARPGRHGIDLAAERDAFPERVVAYLPAQLDAATAERCLASAKAVQADAALIVCASADPEARRKLIATRAKWIEPAAIATLQP